ncbi:MAG: hypothetical protein JSS62_06325 [Verrucomicrobia bacterium]|nr:hypothetical protein [Verrucomicrobiota bacterium]
MIFINTMPKSGSVYIISVLEQSLKHFGYQFTRVSQLRFHDDYMDPLMILRMINVPFYAQGHVDATDYNLDVLAIYFPRFILNVRDPRQAMLSWLHHIEVEAYKKCSHAFFQAISVLQMSILIGL